MAGSAQRIEGYITNPSNSVSPRFPSPSVRSMTISRHNFSSSEVLDGASFTTESHGSAHVSSVKLPSVTRYTCFNESVQKQQVDTLVANMAASWVILIYLRIYSSKLMKNRFFFEIVTYILPKQISGSKMTGDCHRWIRSSTSIRLNIFLCEPRKMI
jgi:hypothetical protein